MKVEELKEEFARLSREDKERFMEEVGLRLCQEMMADTAFMERMMPRCMDMMGQMQEGARRRMQDFMAGIAGGRKP